MDGYVATRIIRKDSRFVDLPIIAMTAHALKGDRERCIEAGMNDYVPKPIDERELYTVLTRWIKPSERPLVKRQAHKSVKDQKLIKEAKWDVPEIPGIDLITGLRQIHGNTGLFKRMLMNSLNLFEDALVKIGNLLENDNTEEARKLTHAIKGVSGNIGAKKLFAAAVNLDEALAKGTAKGIDRLFDSFVFELDYLSKSLKRLKFDTDHDDTDCDDTDRTVKTDKNNIAPILIEMKNLLKMSSSRSRYSMIALKKELTDAGHSELLCSLENAMYRLDSDRALSVLSELAEKLDISLSEDDI